MRGEHDAIRDLDDSELGIIPACAGSTEVVRALGDADAAGSSPHARGARASAGAAPTVRPDHPRMRGEHARTITITECLLRIIPACAGSTERRSSGRTWRGGSSPHARGAPPSLLGWS